jgi:GntR family transcriptional regulator, transcriptional repressor for pyruvate dehydrogenase complex
LKLPRERKKEIFRPLQRSNLVDDAIAQIREMIVSGHFSAGQRLPSETDVAKQLSVGRSTIREALRVLSHLGLVESRAGSGTYVASQIRSDIEVTGSLELPGLNEVYEFRYAIEVACAPLAAERRTDAQMKAIRETWSQSRAAAIDNDLVRFAVADTAFHSEIVKASGNDMFVAAYRFAAPMIVEAVTAILAVGQLKSMRDFHDGLVRALERRNAKAASQAVNENFREAAARLHLLGQTPFGATRIAKPRRSPRTSKTKSAG